MRNKTQQLSIMLRVLKEETEMKDQVVREVILIQNNSKLTQKLDLITRVDQLMPKINLDLNKKLRTIRVKVQKVVTKT